MNRLVATIAAILAVIILGILIWKALWAWGSFL